MPRRRGQIESSTPATEETWVVGREKESCQGIGRKLFKIYMYVCVEEPWQLQSFIPIHVLPKLMHM
jgi:hypothetical protein